MKNDVNRCLNIADLNHLAKRRLPKPIYNSLEYGAEDQFSVKHNSDAFNQLQIKPRSVRDVGRIDMRTRVLGQDLEWPVLLSPVGMTRLFHPDGELAAARAAAKNGSLYIASAFSSVSMEQIAAESRGPKMFQTYVFADPELNRDMADRARAAGYSAMCLTVDSIIGGNREEVVRSGMSLPLKLTLKSALQFVSKPAWLSNYLKGDKLQLANLIDASSRASTHYGLLEPRLSWDHVERIIRQWNGPFAIKGIMSGCDARRAVEVGASAVIISNHGGRQLDTTPAPIELVREVREAVGPEIDVIVDGGIRRGTHILKALAMGATACSIGRPYLYGLAAGGQLGVERSLSLLRSELERNMTLAGCRDLNDCDSDLLRRVGFD